MPEADRGTKPMTRKILFVVPYVPNLIRVRPYNLIRYLAERGHEITIATLWMDEDERRSLADLEPLVEQVHAARLTRRRAYWNSLLAVPTRRPLQSAYCWQPDLARRLEGRIRRADGRSAFDLVHVEHLRGARYGLHLKRSIAASGLNIPVVWDSVDSISYLFRQAMKRSRNLFSRAMTRFELGRTEFFEGWLLGQFERVLVTSRADQKALQQLWEARRAAEPGSTAPDISVLPNGVDLDYFTPGSGPREPKTIVISGKMSYHANVTMVLYFARQIMPLVWDRHPETRLVIVGKDPAPEITALGGDERIEVTGTVPHLPPYLQKATLAAAPIAYGAGIQNKVLEAMACQTPVVASSQAVSALMVEPGRDLLVADQPGEFAEAVSCLLENPGRRAEIGAAGRRYVERRHAWPAIAGQLERIYEAAIAESRAPNGPGYKLA